MKRKVLEALLLLGWVFVFAGFGMWIYGDVFWRNIFAALAALCFIPDWLFFEHLTIYPRNNCQR